MEQQSLESEHERISTVVKVKSAATIEALYEIIRSIGSIPGSRGDDYSFDAVIQVIERARHGHIKSRRSGELVLRFPPRAFGIREKVRELLVSDPVFLKEQKRGRIPQGWEDNIPMSEPK